MGSAIGKILVMDDDEMVRYIAGQTLERVGFTVAYAEDGREAVALYKKSIADGTPFAAVILDLNIPGGMGGIEALQKLREIDSAVKAFVSSGNGNDPAMINCRQHGFRGVVEKPYFYLNAELLDEFIHAVADNKEA
jgi:CheY-like chemotaxis protein